MSAAAIDRVRARREEHHVEGQVEVDQLDELLDAMAAQTRTTYAVIALAKTWSKKHKRTLRIAAGLESAA